MTPIFRLVAPIAVIAAIATAACATAGPSPKNAQFLAIPVDSCVLARETAAADPRLDVDKVPAPVKMEPAPIRRPVPRSALNRNGSSTIRVEVLVDTLGKPDMGTFNVLESSNAWFVTGAKSAIAKWTFTPAERYGCKVARYYLFAASSPARAAR